MILNFTRPNSSKTTVAPPKSVTGVSAGMPSGALIPIRLSSPASSSTVCMYSVTVSRRKNPSGAMRRHGRTDSTRVYAPSTSPSARRFCQMNRKTSSGSRVSDSKWVPALVNFPVGQTDRSSFGGSQMPGSSPPPTELGSIPYALKLAQVVAEAVRRVVRADLPVGRQ